MKGDEYCGKGKERRIVGRRKWWNEKEEQREEDCGTWLRTVGRREGPWEGEVNCGKDRALGKRELWE